MADLTASREIDVRDKDLRISRKLTVKAATTIYKGQIVGIDASGYAIHALTTTKVAGMAQHDAAAGETVTVWINYVVKLAYASAAVTDVGNAAYAADSSDATTSSNTAILGPIVDWESGYFWVWLTTRA
jgi:hypothetical protein